MIAYSALGSVAHGVCLQILVVDPAPRPGSLILGSKRLRVSAIYDAPAQLHPDACCRDANRRRRVRVGFTRLGWVVGGPEGTHRLSQGFHTLGRT